MCAPREPRPDLPRVVEGASRSRGRAIVGLGVALGLAACTGPGARPATEGHAAEAPRPAAGASAGSAVVAAAPTDVGASAGAPVVAAAPADVGASAGAPVGTATNAVAPGGDSPPGEVAPVAAAPTDVGTSVGSPVVAGAPTNADAPAVGEPTPGEAAPVGEPTPDGSKDPPLLPAAPPAPTSASIERHAPVWELVQEYAGPVQLERLAGGVLVRVDGRPHELGPDGALVAKMLIDPPNRMLLPPWASTEGTWPDDPWRVASLDTRASTYTSFYRWRGHNRWVAQPFAGWTKVSPEEFETYAWTPRGGLLLVTRDGDDAVFHRLAGKYDAPAPMTVGAGDVRGLIETADGALFVFVNVPDPPQARGLDILRSCKKGEVSPCERTGGAALARPDGALATFFVGETAARGRRDVTAEISESATRELITSQRHYLVHHERGAWKLEPVPDEQNVAHLLAAADGGVWITLQDENTKKDSLWHRSDAGKWVGVDLPGRAADTARIEVAMRDADHVWLAVNSGDHHALYATPATLRPPTP